MVKQKLREENHFGSKNTRKLGKINYLKFLSRKGPILGTGGQKKKINHKNLIDLNLKLFEVKIIK